MDIRPIRVEPRDGFCIWLEYDDGAAGLVDLSDRVGQGVFQIWDEPGVFESVRITEDDAIAWSDDAQLCPDALYLELTGKAVEDIWPALTAAAVDG